MMCMNLSIQRNSLVSYLGLLILSVPSLLPHSFLIPSLLLPHSSNQRLFIENYKCCRLPLQALLQSLPQAIFMTFILATQTNIPTAVLSASLALAFINVIGHASHFVAQARLQYGGPGISLCAFKHLAIDAISLQGAVQVWGYGIKRIGSGTQVWAGIRHNNFKEKYGCGNMAHQITCS